MPNLWVQESWIDATQECHLGRGEPYESMFETPGELFRQCLAEHGRCVSKVYRDGPNGRPCYRAIGWVFQKRMEYTDCKETYLLETWVTLHERAPERTVRYFYRYLDGKGEQP